MSDMVEKVAKAIWDSTEVPDWADAPETVRAMCRGAARAAIEELRNISIAEKGAGVSAYVKVAGQCRPVALKAAWEAILHAALKGEAE